MRIEPCIAVRAASTRDKGSRSWTIGEEPPFPRVELVDRLGRVELYRQMVEWLKVDEFYRWKPNAGKTYCNIYASDVCHLLGLYLPRQWWRNPSTGRPPIDYGVNTRELGANALHDWLIEFGPQFGWVQLADGDELREYLNNTGGVGLVSARRKDRSRSGHITVAFPDSTVPAGSANGLLQSQAGTVNHRWFRGLKLRKGSTYDSVVFFAEAFA